MTVTLADVAAHARVSPATVSRVLNGNYPVAAATRERVLRAVSELDYVVNGPASALAAATSDLVGILVNDIADPFFGIMAGAAQAHLNAPADPSAPVRTNGERLAVVCNTGGSPARELTYLTLLQRQRAAAVILTGGAIEDDEHSAAVAAKLARLAEAGTRIVLCGRPALSGPGAGPVHATLSFDNRAGARRLTEHLLGLGHTRIGYVAGPAERTTTRHRLEGHRDALSAAGVAHDPALVLHGSYDRASGRAAAAQLLSAAPDLTAIVAANDTIALGVCAGARERGLRIPEDLSVTGFDDLPSATDAVPALTTVRLPLYEAGARAGALATGAGVPGGVEVVPAELVVRGSTKAPL
ncbi:LacI family transcriptional regulator [Streptomyces spiroverticillatus]|uniref:LacI family transcriptional regulator n=1 Tax=Streptomyces finlayi TaxID=67296 RepID=A0A918WY98_9ACTN|nr:LacI family DNA-binding transcriptional regulator [Streptomyces finlayi]GHA11168.1 LacI family transcriptional regulator [Streptomyces spiroverticillatus]GHC95140.1 LacI family transcriptional regulator [Streptomyces finlayi]